MSFENEQEPLAERAGDGAERVLTGIVRMLESVENSSSMCWLVKGAKSTVSVGLLTIPKDVPVH
jgi:hypothetical protein